MCVCEPNVEHVHKHMMACSLFTISQFQIMQIMRSSVTTRSDVKSFMSRHWTISNVPPAEPATCNHTLLYF